METVELRVHGVHGTSPGAMLGVEGSEVGQVAGDGLTGIYRANGPLPYRDLTETGVSVEAYSWGALTSGVQGFLGWVKRALWLILLPFALVNLAYWARLELGRSTGQARWGARAVRASGLLLTVFFVLTPCVLAIDLAAWQCYRYGVPGCSRIPDQLNFLAGWAPGQRLALATLVPMATVLVLWLLSKTSMSRYESVKDALDSPPALSTQHVLLHPKLWNGTARTQRLQRFHLTAGIATVIVFSGIHMLHASRFPRPGGWALLLWLTVLLGALLLVIAALLVTVTHEDDVEPLVATTYGGGAPALVHRARALTPVFDTAVLGLTTVVYLLHLVALSTVQPTQHAGKPTVTVNESLDFTGRNVWFIAVFVGLTVLHLSIFTGGRMKPRSAVLIVFSTLGAVLVIVALRFMGLYDAGDAWPVFGAAVVAVGFWLMLALWQYRHAPAVHDDKAWRGAGASVLLATAAWIALLFASGTVIATANYLNGTTHGVGDLVSRVEGRRVAPTTLDLASQYSTHQFVATGDVTLSHARITVSDDLAHVTSGTIEMKGLSLAVDPYVASHDPFTEGRGRTIVAETSTLTVPGHSLVLQDSCLRDAKTRCTAEEQQFHSAGVLTLPGRAGDNAPVTLTIEKGVALAPTDAPQVPLAVPQVLIWTPIGQLLWLVVVALAVIACLVLFTRKVSPKLAEMFASGQAPDDQVPQRDRARSLKARQSAALAHRAETLLDVVGAITSPVALIIVVASMSGVPPWELDLPLVGWTREVATASMYLVVGMSAGLILLGSQIRRSEKTRKAVGVIWDLTTFWPRAAHPLAPPCYAERVVPELHIRTRWALDMPHAMPNQVVVSGHSQGSLIVLAMASRLNPVHLSRVRMITYGSQIRALYGRVFPRVFGPDEIGYQPTSGQPSLTDAFPDVPRPVGRVPGPPPLVPDTFRYRLRTAGGEWINLFRRTDPLGWRVFSDIDSDLDLPVPEVPQEAVGDPGPAVMGHSGYQHTPTYRRVVARWTHETFVPPPPGTENLPTLPPL
ncbi:MAG: hypothetical protein ABIR34_09865 [Marmoricola sp.]